MLDPNFEQTIKRLRVYCKAKQDCLTGDSYDYSYYRDPQFAEAMAANRWMLFDKIKGVVDIKNINAGGDNLDRTRLNQDLFRIYTKGGTQGELIVDAVQMQFLQALERALIHRRLTPGRALAHLYARYESHAYMYGIFQDLLNQIYELNQKSTK